MTNSSGDADIINKRMLYGEFTDSMRENRTWRERLAEKASHKALDIAMDPPPFGINTVNKTGIGLPGILGVGAIAAGSVLGGAYLAKDDPATIQPPAPIVQPANPGAPAIDRDTDTTGEYDIGWDR